MGTVVNIPAARMFFARCIYGLLRKLIAQSVA